MSTESSLPNAQDSHEKGEVAPVPAQPAKRPRMITVQLALFVVLGALAGFAYYRFVGCRSGACPITANPYISTIYGAVLGLLLSGGVK